LVYRASNGKDVFPKECSVGDDAVHVAHQSRLNSDDDLDDLHVRLNMAVGIYDLSEREGAADVIRVGTIGAECFPKVLLVPSKSMKKMDSGRLETSEYPRQ
jgi:hypothetical protein